MCRPQKLMEAPSSLNSLPTLLCWPSADTVWQRYCSQAKCNSINAPWKPFIHGSKIYKGGLDRWREMHQNKTKHQCFHQLSLTKNNNNGGDDSYRSTLQRLVTLSVAPNTRRGGREGTSIFPYLSVRCTPSCCSWERGGLYSLLYQQKGA